jgi:hypothetical protein
VVIDPKKTAEFGKGLAGAALLLVLAKAFQKAPIRFRPFWRR